MKWYHHAVLLGLGGSLLWAASYSQIRYQEVQKEAKELREVIAAQALDFNRFNQIAQVNSNEKQQIQRQSEISIAYIHENLSADECATRSIPADVVNRLRDHANKIRHGSNRANSE